MDKIFLKAKQIFSRNQNLGGLFIKAFKSFDLESIDYYTILDIIEYSRLDYTSNIETLTVILICMFNSLNVGSLCLRLNNPELIVKLNLLTESHEASKKLVDNFIRNIESFDRVISIGTDQYKPLVLKEYKDEKYLYFQKYFNNEFRLKNTLDKFLINEDRLDISKHEKEILRILHDSNLNEKQKLAVFLSLIKNLVIISGGPGTGKTSVIYWLLKAMIKCEFDPKRIRLACPTGRAAHRLTESIKASLSNETDEEMRDKLNNLEGQTIHRLLNYSMNSNQFGYNEKNSLPADVLIIDEVSMIDIVMMTRLMTSISPDTKVILLGDKNQIPSIEAGAVLAELIPSEFREDYSLDLTEYFKGVSASGEKSRVKDRVILLEKSYRSTEKILEIAEEINKQNIDVIDRIRFINSSDPAESLSFMENHSFFEFKQLLLKWAHTHFLGESSEYLRHIHELSKVRLDNDNIENIRMPLESLFKIAERYVILCITKQGAYSTGTINKFYKNLFIERINIYNGFSFSGMPVIITQNDYMKELFNGDRGIILKDSTNHFKAVFRKNNSFIFHPIDFLSSYESAFSITIHKSQGSEYDEVLIVLPDNQDNPLLTKEILYTGLTRAKKKAIIYGKETILRKIISSKITREAGIKLWE